MKLIRFVPDDGRMPDAGELVPGAGYLGVIAGMEAPMDIKDIVPPKPFEATKRGWGLIAAAVAAVLPYVNGLIADITGIHIDAPIVALVGEAVTRIIDAVGVGAGVALFVWGSIFPTAPLTFEASPAPAPAAPQRLMSAASAPSWAGILQSLLVSLSAGAAAGGGMAGSGAIAGGGLIGVLAPIGLACLRAKLAKKRR